MLLILFLFLVVIIVAMSSLIPNKLSFRVPRPGSMADDPLRLLSSEARGFALRVLGFGVQGLGLRAYGLGFGV